MVAVGAAAFIAAGVSMLTTGFTKGGDASPLEVLGPAALGAAGGAVGGWAAGPALGAVGGAGGGGMTAGGTGLGLGTLSSTGVSSVGSSAAAAGGITGASSLLQDSSISAYLGSSALPQTAAPVVAESPSFFSGIGAKELLQAGVQLGKPLASLALGGPDMPTPLPPTPPPLLDSPPPEQARDYKSTPAEINAANRRRRTSDAALAEQRAEEELGKVSSLVAYQDALKKTGKGRLISQPSSLDRLSGVAGSYGGFRPTDT